MTKPLSPAPVLAARVAEVTAADKRYRLRLRHEVAATEAARLLAALANMPPETPEYARNVAKIHFADAAVAVARLQAEMEGARA